MTSQRLVVIKLDGHLDQGFKVTLEIGFEGERPAIETMGSLPQAPELAACLQYHWRKKYYALGAPARLKVKRVIYDGSVDQQVKECRRSGENLSNRFQQWLNSEQFLPIDKRLREELSRDEVIRFFIRTEDPNLHKLPWHLWDFFERYPFAEVAMSSPQSELAIKSTIAIPQSKLRILAILGHSEGINVDADRQLLESLPNAEVAFLVEPQLFEINHRLWEQPWDMIFFAGHSETEGEKGRMYINQTDSLTIDELWYALRKAVERGLKLAIFNSCEGLGLAQQLNDLQIPQMIVMRELVPDRVAQEFLKYFLMAFSTGKSFYLAVREARERLQGLESKFPCASWLPTIFQNPAEPSVTWEEMLDTRPSSSGCQRLGKTITKYLTKWKGKLLSSALAFTLAFLMGVSFTYGINFNQTIVRRPNIDFKSSSYLAIPYPREPTLQQGYESTMIFLDLSVKSAQWSLSFTKFQHRNRVCSLGNLEQATLKQNGKYLKTSGITSKSQDWENIHGIISRYGKVNLVLNPTRNSVANSQSYVSFFQSTESFLEDGEVVIRGNVVAQNCDLIGIFEMRSLNQ